MDTFINRYRNISVLMAVIFSQLILLAWQVRTRQDTQGARVWAVTAVTPLARVVEEMRSGTVNFFKNYTMLSDAQRQNVQFKKELDALKLENSRLKTDLEFADRVKALASFQQHSPFRYLGARITANAPGATAKVVYVDRGSAAGVVKGMSVVTPDGLVGKVVAAYPTASLLMMLNDPTFAVGVISQKNRVRGVAKGKGQNLLVIDYVQNEQKLDLGELFYTSGEDRAFPKGILVGKVVSVRVARPFKEVQIDPVGLQASLEEVLIVTGGGHQPIPAEITAAPSQEMQLLTPPTASEAEDKDKFQTDLSKAETDADRIQQHYKRIEGWNGGKLGTSGRIPNFNTAPPETKGAPEVQPEPQVAGPAPARKKQ
jgi:rod shape-determining protein MreC